MECRRESSKSKIAVGRLGGEQMPRERLDLGFKEGLWEGVGVRGAEQESSLPDLDMNDSLVLRNVFLLSSQPRYEYHWADGTNIKKPIKCSAPKYIDYLMTWVQDQLDDETLFPSKIGKVNK